MDALRMQRIDSVRFQPDCRRVIAKPFLPREEVYPDGTSRMQLVLDRILQMSDRDVAQTLAVSIGRFEGRHRDLEALLVAHFEIAVERLTHGAIDVASLSADRRCLIGAYFTHEYSIEAAALGNPSIVAAPDQSGVAAGDVRFIMSLRGIGEGHLSSIEFRSGVVSAGPSVQLDDVSGFVGVGERFPQIFDKAALRAQFVDVGAFDAIEASVLKRLPERFDSAELETVMVDLEGAGTSLAITADAHRLLYRLASSNYNIVFAHGLDISERVLFPSGPAESQGMEDARFVRFVGDDGAVTYFATYTAFDGHQITPQLIETTDFREFRVTTLTGRLAHNKGMAIFPRRIGGRFVALGRHDNVNNYLMTSDDIRVWRDATIIQEPERPWELMQLGNCGSPLETEAGWLVVTHGVGPFRRYTLGALLLDLDDPTRVIGHLKEPMLSPNDDEREGYVPNVVYSCGGMLHDGSLILSYGFADVGAGIATVPVDDLLSAMTFSAR